MAQLDPLVDDLVDSTNRTILRLKNHQPVGFSKGINMMTI